MADGLDAVTQPFIADFSGYVDPMEAAAGDTEGLVGSVEELNGVLDELTGSASAAGASMEGAAGEAAGLHEKSDEARDAVAGLGAAAGETSGQIDALAASQEGALGTTEQLTEAQHRLRDAAAETNVALGTEELQSLAAAGSAVDDYRSKVRGLQDLLSAGSDTRAAALAGAGLGADESLFGSRSALDDYHAKLNDLANLLRDTDEGAEEAAQSLGAVAPEAESMFGQITSGLPSLADLNFQMIGLGAVVATAVPVVVDAGTSVAALGAAGALAYPDVKRVWDVLSGAAPDPGRGVIGQAVTDIRTLQSEFGAVAGSSGIGQNLLGDALPAAVQAAENVLHDMTPLAKAGATSFGDIAGAIERVTASSGFKSFLSDLAQQAPQDTQAILGLAGAVGGALTQSFEEAGPHVAATVDELTGAVQELSGPTATAVTDITIGVGGFAGAFAGAVGAAKYGTDFLTGQLERITGSAGDAGGSTRDFAAANRAVQQPEVISFLESLVGDGYDGVRDGATAAANAAAKNAKATSEVQTEAQAAARATSAFDQQMSTATGTSGTLASRVTALSTALANEGNTTAGSLGAIASFHQGMTTLESDMTASANRAGYLNAAQETTAEEFATMYTQATNASAGLLATGSSAGHAAGPLEELRGEMEKIIDPTAAERALLQELNAEIDALKSRTIYEHVVISTTQTGGQAPVSGTVAHDEGASFVTPGSRGPSPGYVFAPHVGGASQLTVHVPVSVHPAVGALTSPEFLQGLQPVIEEAILRHAYNNQSSGTHFGGYTRGF